MKCLHIAMRSQCLHINSFNLRALIPLYIPLCNSLVEETHPPNCADCIQVATLNILISLIFHKLGIGSRSLSRYKFSLLARIFHRYHSNVLQCSIRGMQYWIVSVMITARIIIFLKKRYYRYSQSPLRPLILQPPPRPQRSLPSWPFCVFHFHMTL